MTFRIHRAPTFHQEPRVGDLVVFVAMDNRTVNEYQGVPVIARVKTVNEVCRFGAPNSYGVELENALFPELGTSFVTWCGRWAEAPGEDLQDWGYPDLADETDRNYDAARETL